MKCKRRVVEMVEISQNVSTNCFNKYFYNKYNDQRPGTADQ